MRTDLPYSLVVDPTGSALRAARECEADVFLDTYGNTTDELAAEYGPYDSASVFVAVMDARGRAVAACRLITPGPAGLKSINDLSRPPWNLDGARAADAAGLDATRTWDVATIAVRRGVGSIRGVAAAALYHGLWSAARANAMTSLVMIMDERARRLLSSLGIITQRVPGAVPGAYLGSAMSTPVFGHLSPMADLQRREHPDAYRLIALGIGLDGIDIPPVGDRVLTRRPSSTPHEWSDLTEPLSA